MIELLARPQQVVVGVETTLTISLVNQGSGPCSNVRVDLEVPGALGLRRGHRRLRLARLSPRSPHDEPLVVRATEAGTHGIDVLNLSFLDELGNPCRIRGLSIPVVAEAAPEPEAPTARRRSIFISYRRVDTEPVAQSLAVDLAQAFPHTVFHDHTSLRPGDDFRRRLDQELRSCDLLLALIGPRWLTIVQERAEGGDEDLVRHEIATALRRRTALIPVLVDGAALPPRHALVEDLAGLVDRHTVRLRADTPEARAHVVSRIRNVWSWSPAAPSER